MILELVRAIDRVVLDTETERCLPVIALAMAPTVDELRNEIRESVGRYERIESTAFTKEALAAIATAVGVAIDTDGRLPPKAQMRSDILAAIGQDVTPADLERQFRKAELESIQAALET